MCTVCETQFIVYNTRLGSMCVCVYREIWYYKFCRLLCSFIIFMTSFVKVHYLNLGWWVGKVIYWLMILIETPAMRTVEGLILYLSQHSKDSIIIQRGSTTHFRNLPDPTVCTGVHPLIQNIEEKSCMQNLYTNGTTDNYLLRLITQVLKASRPPGPTAC